MSATPVQFLTALAQALSTMNLYAAGHPMRTRSIELCLTRLASLREADAQPLFSFIDTDVIYGTQPLHEMRQWQWALRLSAAGVQRLEFGGAVTADEFEAVLEQLLRRLAPSAPENDAAATIEVGAVRFGAVGLRDTEARQPGAEPERPAAFAFPLDEEVAAVRWLLTCAAERAAIPDDEARAVARSLCVMSRQDDLTVIPLVRLARFEDYAVAHALNVAALSACLADEMGLAGGAQAAAVAGLLHDVGMTRVPPDVAARNTLTPEEQVTMREHVRIGSRMIFRSAPGLELAAIAAYEHHLRPDGGGYPECAAGRTPHAVSRLVSVCSVYHALVSSRFHWPAWSGDQALAYIEERAGTEFDTDAVQSFATMLRRPSTCILPVAEAGAADA